MFCCLLPVVFFLLAASLLLAVFALYACFWGLVTALARPVAGMSSELNFWGADQFVHEALLRAPHFLIPLYLAVFWYKPRKKSTGDLASVTESVPDS